ncbi:hypothetical protein QJR60_11390 [Paraclostridium sordellii]|uniref:hypothetical protein n=1 Tax=Paraclostridium sordellii TaxID=1505 RepID=UPI0028FE39D1|nr:hypothetical protein [Paeniclostridium sordellii]
MKKIIIIIVSILLGISMVGCESSVSKKAVEQGKLAMANKEYDKALASFKLAIDEGSNNKEVKRLTTLINHYTQANDKFKKGDIKSANKIMNEIDEETIDDSIKNDIDNLKAKINQQDKINKKIASIKELIKYKKYDDAKKSIKEIDIDKINKKDKNEINELKDTIELGLSQVKVENKSEDNKKMKKDQENKNNQESSKPIEIDESYNSEDNKLYVCENCDKVSNEHNFVAGKNVCDNCFEILSQEIMTEE